MTAMANTSPTKNYVDSAQVAAWVQKLREFIRQTETFYVEYLLWKKQAERVPNFELELQVMRMKDRGVKIEDLDFLDKISNIEHTEYYKAAQYYRQKKQTGKQPGENAIHSALHQNKIYFESWKHDLTDGNSYLDVIFNQRSRILLDAFQKIDQSSMDISSFKEATKELDVFDKLAWSCIDSVPKIFNMALIWGNLPFHEMKREHEDAYKSALNKTQNEYKASSSTLKQVKSQIFGRLIEASKGDFFSKLAKTRQVIEVPTVFTQYFGLSELANSARADKAIASAYDAQLKKLEAAERAEEAARLAKVRATEAREAQARAQELKRKIASNAAPTETEVAGALTRISAKRSAKNLKGEFELTGLTSYSIYGSFLGSRFKTTDYQINVKNLKCRPTGDTQHCSYTELSRWVDIVLLFSGFVHLPPNDDTRNNMSAVFRWTENGLVAASDDIEVSHIVRTVVRRGGSNSNSGDTGEDLQSVFMGREIDNRQNYFDKSQGMGSGAPAYDPSKRY